MKIGSGLEVYINCMIVDRNNFVISKFLLVYTKTNPSDFYIQLKLNHCNG
jgi:hypothetical protein